MRKSSITYVKCTLFSIAIILLVSCKTNQYYIVFDTQQFNFVEEGKPYLAPKVINDSLSEMVTHNFSWNGLNHSSRYKITTPLRVSVTYDAKQTAFTQISPNSPDDNDDFDKVVIDNIKKIKFRIKEKKGQQSNQYFFLITIDFNNIIKD